MILQINRDVSCVEGGYGQDGEEGEGEGDGRIGFADKRCEGGEMIEWERKGMGGCSLAWSLRCCWRI